MKFPVELIKHSRAAYVGPDNSVMVTIQFPLLENILTWDEVQTFDLIDFLSIIKDEMVYLHIWDKKLGAVRLHGFDMNQPVRISFPDYSCPLVVVVLQVYMNPLDVGSIANSPLYLEY